MRENYLHRFIYIIDDRAANHRTALLLIFLCGNDLPTIEQAIAQNIAPINVFIYRSMGDTHNLHFRIAEGEVKERY